MVLIPTASVYCRHWSVVLRCNPGNNTPGIKHQAQIEEIGTDYSPSIKWPEDKVSKYTSDSQSAVDEYTKTFRGQNIIEQET
jgi:hypothetical protein